ncbi:MAG: spore germination protein [Bacillota bacterium]
MRPRLIKKLKDLLIQSQKPRWTGRKSPMPSRPAQPEGDPDKVWEPSELEKTPVSADLEENLRLLRELLGQNTDFVIRELAIGPRKTPAAVAYFAPLVDGAKISDHVLRGLTTDCPQDLKISLASIAERAVTLAGVEEAGDLWAVSDGLLGGRAMLFVSGEDRALELRVRGYEGRAVQESSTESVVRGPRDAFVENVGRNMMLVRQRIRTPNLVLERFYFGRLTRTSVVVGYIKGLAAPDLVREVRERLERIDVDALLASNFIEEVLADNPYSPFPQALATERPDRIAAYLAEGKVMLIVDTTPFVLIVPATLPMLLQSPEDYYHPFGISTVIRWLRYLAFVVSLIVSPLYVAITTFHQEMIPFELLLNIAGAREGVPLPAALEALLMEGTFELLREAGIRLPRSVGQAISIVGALVIGQSAVTAGLVSPQMVIVVALAGISSFASPSYELAIPLRLLRFPLIFLAASLGLFGVTTGVLAIIIHLAGLRSFGVPYLSPLAPLKFNELKDVLVRAPLWAMRTRPGTSKRNWHRMAPGLKPGPPEDK